MRAEAGHAYSAYGLTLHANWPVPALLPICAPATFDVVVHFDSNPPIERSPQERLLYSSPGHNARGVAYFSVYRRDTGGLHCRLSTEQGDADFMIDALGKRIDIATAPAIEREDLIAYLTGPVLGCVLRVRGTLCLHAGVIGIDGAAVALIGPKGVGKSTLTAGFAATGYPVLADDIAALTIDAGGIGVAPGYPRLRLWPDTIEHIIERDVQTMPRVLASMEKRFQPLSMDVDAKQWRFQCSSLPLMAICLLSPDATGGEPKIATRQHGSASLLAVLPHLYASYAVAQARRPDEFRCLTEVLARVPLLSVNVPRNLEQVGKVRNTVSRFVRTLASA